MASRLRARWRSADAGNITVAVCYAFFLFAYFVGAIYAASVSHLWMDEVLAVWTSRLGSVQLIRDALLHGAEFSPPTYHVGLHILSSILGQSYLVMRAPSLAAALIVAVCILRLVGPYLGWAPAAFCACLVLESIRVYAIEARPYAPAIACFACALVAWDGIHRDPKSIRCPILMGVMLALATSLHFYSVLFVLCVGVSELIYSAAGAVFRVRVWGALFAAGASIFVWMPNIRAIGQYNGADIHSPEYFARPTVARLIQVYCDLLFGSRLNQAGVIAIVCMIAVYALRSGPKTAAILGRRGRLGQAPFWSMALGTALLPLITFIFSVLVSGTYHIRYTVAGVIGLAAVVSAVVACKPNCPLVVSWVMVGMAGFELLPRPNVPDAFRQPSLIAQLKGTRPIIVSEGLAFFELEEGAPPEIKSRLLYVTMPGGVQITDPTNEHQVERWKAIQPALQVIDAVHLLATSREYYLIDTGLSNSSITDLLLSRGLLDRPCAHAGAGWVFLVRPAKSELRYGR